MHTLLAQHTAPLVLDVRSPEEFAGALGHIGSALLLPLPELEGRLSELVSHRGPPMVTVCKSEGRSVRAAALLREHHFPTVAVLAGGMEAWHQAGLPVAGQRRTPAAPEAPSGVGASGYAERP